MNLKKKHLWITAVVFVLIWGASALPVGAACTPSDTGTGGNDSILCNAANPPAGTVKGKLGNDTIDFASTVTVTLRGDDDLTAPGDDDSIIVRSGAIAGSVEGDVVLALTHHGGDDTIVVEAGGRATKVVGDIADGSGGLDSIHIAGTVSGNVVGDEVNLKGQNDTLFIAIGGSVGGDVIGDDAGTFSGFDAITVGGTVTGDVIGDEAATPSGDLIIITGTANDVYGDNRDKSATVVGGADDISILGGTVTNIFGDGDTSGGGDDTITVGVSSTVTVDVRGDSSNGDGGDDSIIISGSVGEDVFGDWLNSAGFTSGDDAIHVDSTGHVNGDVSGDDESVFFLVDGGNDSIMIDGTVDGDVLGDWVGGIGGDDNIFLSNALVKGDVVGDRVGGDGGDDTIQMTDSLIEGDLFGDDIEGVNALGGKDSIDIIGTINGDISGDDDAFEGRSGRDTISVVIGSLVKGSVSGDRTKKAGSKDRIIINGQVNKTVFGDNTNRAGGGDFIVINGTVKRNVFGDYVKKEGGDDTIKIEGTVDKNVYGDGARSNANAFSNGGDDSITVESGGLVRGNVEGDDALFDGGDDTITIKGTVNGDVIGDRVGDEGGTDSITVSSGGLVKGNVVGDHAGTPANGVNEDVFVIDGTVLGTIYLDNVGGPTLDVAGDASAIDLAIGGNDIIFVAGQIGGDILSATGLDGDDIFVIQDGATVGGMMDAGAHQEGDRLIFNLRTKSKGEFGKLSALFDDLTIEEGRVTYRGNQYKWVNFEFLQYAVQLLQTQTLPLYCSGIYEKNAEGTACVRKGQEEYDAIMFHRNNPGYDGRMPGTEACAIYNYGNAMRVYEVVDGSEGELVTTISADVFNHNIESNLLLASSASGNVNVYYLMSNEVQVECTDWTGKTQVRIIPDFSGTVNASFDKVGG